jgi:hypothetical protein
MSSERKPYEGKDGDMYYDVCNLDQKLWSKPLFLPLFNNFNQQKSLSNPLIPESVSMTSFTSAISLTQGFLVNSRTSSWSFLIRHFRYSRSYQELFIPGSGLRISWFGDLSRIGLVKDMKVGFSGILNLWLLYWGPVDYQYLSDMCYSFKRTTCNNFQSGKGIFPSRVLKRGFWDMVTGEKQ